MSYAFQIGDTVAKINGSEWEGTIVGFYSTDLTPLGYCVESDYHDGSVQIYPEAALMKREVEANDNECTCDYDAFVRAGLLSEIDDMAEKANGESVGLNDLLETHMAAVTYIASLAIRNGQSPDDVAVLVGVVYGEGLVAHLNNQ